MKPYDHPGDSEHLLCCTGGPPGVDCNKKPAIAAVADDADPCDPFYYRGQAFCEEHWPTPETSPFEAPTEGEWAVTVTVPANLPEAHRDQLFADISDAAFWWEAAYYPAPDGRDGWDVDVSGTPVGEATSSTPTYPRWEVRPDEPGGLAWVTSADEFEDNGFDVEELFRYLDWQRSKRCKEAVAALVGIVKAASS